MIDGVRVWKVRYQETRRPTIIRTSAGKDMPLKGTFWLDPVEGRVLKTHMEMTSEVRVSGKRQEWGQERGEPVARAAPKSGIREWSDRRVDSNASITVTYKADPRLGILLPAEMLETYEGAWARRTTNEEALTKISCRATYSDFKRFETTGKVIERSSQGEQGLRFPVRPRPARHRG